MLRNVRTWTLIDVHINMNLWKIFGKMVHLPGAQLLTDNIFTTNILAN